MVGGSQEQTETPILLSEQEEIVSPNTNTTGQKREVERSIENFDKQVQQELESAYAIVVRRKLNKRISTHLRNFLNYFEDPFLSPLKTEIMNQLQPEEKVLCDKFTVSSSQKKMSYDELCKLYQAVNASVKILEKKPDQAQNRALWNVAASSLDVMQPMVAYKIPALLTKAKKILVVQETYYTSRPKKKSFFRRMIERVFPFLKKNDDIVVKKVEEKITSKEKVLAGIATDVVADSFKSMGEDLFGALKNRIEYQKNVASGKVMDIAPSTEILSQQTKPALQPGKAKTAAKAAVVVATAVDKGINEWVAAKLNRTTPGSYLEYALNPGSEVTHTTLAEHFQSEFSMAAQKEMHNGIVSFVRNLTELYITANRLKQAGYVDIEASQFGFKRLEEPEFKEFMLNMIRALGYPANGFEDLQSFLYFTTDPRTLKESNYPSKKVYEQVISDLKQQQKVAFDKFTSVLPGDRALGSQAVTTFMATEHAKAMSSKGDENYFYILNLHQQATADLQSKERIQQAVDLAAHEFHIEESVYNPENKGLATKITGQLKGEMVAKIPELVRVFLQTAITKEEQAKTQFEMMNNRWLIKMNELYEAELRVEKKPVTKGLSVNELRAAWDESAVKTAELALQFSEVKAAVSHFHEGAMKQWQQTSILLLMKCVELGGENFLKDILQQLEKNLNELKTQGTHQVFSDQLQMKINALQLIIPPKGKILDQENLRLSLETCKLVFDAMNEGITSMYRKNANLSLEEKENLYMMSQALSVMNNSYKTFDYAKKAYEEVYKTHFDTINTMPSIQVGQFITDKLGKFLEKELVNAMNDPLVQFDFYAKQKIAGKHILTEQAKAPVEEPKQQGWLAWAAEKTYNAASYVLPLGVKSAEVLAVPVLLGAGSIYLAKLYKQDVAPDPKSINQAVCDNAKSYIRAQVYDAMIKMLPQMNALLNSTEDAAVFSSCGLGDRRNFAILVNNLSHKLGFENVQQFMKFHQMFEEKKQEVEKLKEELGKIWWYKDEPQAKLNKANEELATLQTIYDGNRQAFAKLPENQAEANQDRFVALKDLIQNEYVNATDAIKRDKLQDGTNYLVLISSLNSLIQQVESVQRQTIAAELFAPDVDALIGYDAQATGILAQLKLAAREDIKSVGSMLTQKGILSQLTESIETASYFSRGLLAGAEHTIALQQEHTHSQEARPMLVANAYRLAQSISEKPNISIVDEPRPSTPRPNKLR